MMTNLLKEQRLSLTQLARQEGVSIPTTWRWAMRGIKGIKLETLQIGGRRYCTQESFARFVEATTRAANGEQPSTKVCTNRGRQADISRAEAELAKDGI
jgi:hypothetical protein